MFVTQTAREVVGSTFPSAFIGDLVHMQISRPAHVSNIFLCDINKGIAWKMARTPSIVAKKRGENSREYDNGRKREVYYSNWVFLYSCDDRNLHFFSSSFSSFSSCLIWVPNRHLHAFFCEQKKQTILVLPHFQSLPKQEVFCSALCLFHAQS